MDYSQTTHPKTIIKVKMVVKYFLKNKGNLESWIKKGFVTFSKKMMYSWTQLEGILSLLTMKSRKKPYLHWCRWLELIFQGSIYR